MYFITAVLSLFLVVNCVSALAGSTNETSISSNKTVRRKSISQGHVNGERFEQKNYKLIDAVDRSGRLIPFVTIYVPIESKDANTRDYYNSKTNYKTLVHTEYDTDSKSKDGEIDVVSTRVSIPSITPFLPSNQLPGPFRPITGDIKSHEQIYNDDTDHTNLKTQQYPTAGQNQEHTQRQFNSIPSYRKLQKDLISKPIKYTAYLNPSEQYIQLLSTTTETMIKSNEPSQIKQYSLFPIIYETEKSDVKSQKYVIDGSLDASMPKSNSGLKVKSNNKYELDPDDGYISKIYPDVFHTTKSRTNQQQKIPQRQHLLEQFHNRNKVHVPKNTESPAVYKFSTNSYKFDNVPFGGSTSENPYRISVISQDTRQHLTETTQIQAPALAHTQYHQLPSNHPPYDVIIKDYNSQSAYNVIPQVVAKVNPVIIYTQNSNGETSVAPTEMPMISHMTDANLISHSNNTLLTDLLRKLQGTSQLQSQLSSDPDNVDVDYSIISLFKVLNDYKKAKDIIVRPPEKKYYAQSDIKDALEDSPLKDSEGSLPGPNTGIPGIDYPVYSEIPKTDFNCKDQRYKGFFGDPGTDCQVWHYCDLNGGHASFLCPNGTIFSQVLLTCDWWFNVKCSSTAQLYVLNERLYKYILPFSPKFPEDYTGPLVDKYLSIKYQEMEEKMRREKNKNRMKSNEENESKSVVSAKLTPSATITVDPNAPLIDEDGQSHNIDNMEQINSTTSIGTDRQYEFLTTISPTDIDTTVTTSITEAYIDPTSPPSTLNPLPSLYEIESERVKVIEIKSDGTSGHLSPLHDQ